MVIMRTVNNNAVSTDELLAGAAEQFKVLRSVTCATLPLVALGPQINVFGGCSTAILTLLGLHSSEDLLQAVDMKGRWKVGYIVSRNRSDLAALGTHNGSIFAPEGEPLEAGSLAVDVVAGENLRILKHIEAQRTRYLVLKTLCQHFAVWSRSHDFQRTTPGMSFPYESLAT